MARPRVIATVRSADEIGFIRVNPATNLIYFTNQEVEVGTVRVLDGATHRIIARMNAGKFPVDLAINPRTNRIYVPNFRSHTVSVMNGRLNRVVQTVKVGLRPDTIGIHTRNNRIYVTSITGKLYVLNGKTNRVQSIIRLGGRPSQIVVNEQTNRIYVTNTGTNSVSVINGSTQSLMTTVTVGNNPVITPALNSATNRIYVANNLSRFLTVINGRTNRRLKNIQLGRLQSEVAVHPRTNRIYVSSAQVEGPGKLFVIDGRTHAIIRTMRLPTSSHLFVNPATNHLFISDYDKNRLIVYHASSLKRIALFPSTAGRIDLNPITNRLYVGGNRTITVIQDAT